MGLFLQDGGVAKLVELDPHRPEPQSAIRLIGALLMEMHEAWTTGLRYLDMEAYWARRGRKHPPRVNHKGHTLPG
ncbi:hypothetical protein Alches_17800 [Alicyclobacillus hesperidum subsp. aegles]|uniref:hypothetical protein n=1 Tax=Alicyclobacillus hesperidum TaxID=89784 RepID=UPI00222DFC3B|nr:hypothetical protein [Alicyclobacillus hesperidum]GLG01740.1 hypothetical protein Alches_17800 [Alicyclobacillus hesperidum subsp. aegles]